MANRIWVDRLRIDPYSLNGSSWQGGVDVDKVPIFGRLLKNQSPIDIARPIEDTSEPGKHLQGNFLWAGPLYDHFGHFMVDSIHRLWAYEPNLHNGVLFAALGNVALNTFMADTLRILGIGADQVFVIREPTNVERVEIVEPGSHLGHGPSDWYLTFLRKLEVNKELINLRDATSTRRVFFGRKHLRSGVVLGEAYFSEKLQSNGFTVIQPEEHSITQQMQIVGGAEQIVFTEGSAVYICELLPSIKTNFYMIPRRNNMYNSFYPHLKPRGSFTLLGKQTNISRIREHPSSASFLLNPEDVFQDMVRRELIGETAFNNHEYESAVALDLKDFNSGRASS